MERVISIAVALAAAILPRSGHGALRNGNTGIDFVFEAQIFSRVER